MPNDLSRRLLSEPNLGPRPIVIVPAPTKHDLYTLLEIRELFENSRLVLLLSDSDEEAVSLGHRLKPRFIGYLTDELSGVAAVVRKMASETRPYMPLGERGSWL